MYACDFSTTAIDIVKVCGLRCRPYHLWPYTISPQNHTQYDKDRCHAFVHDLAQYPLPLPSNSLSAVTAIFVLSALHPDRFAGQLSSFSFPFPHHVLCPFPPFLFLSIAFVDSFIASCVSLLMLTWVHRMSTADFNLQCRKSSGSVQGKLDVFVFLVTYADYFVSINARKTGH